MSGNGYKYESVFPKAHHDILKCFVFVHNPKIFILEEEDNQEIFTFREILFWIFDCFLFE